MHALVATTCNCLILFIIHLPETVSFVTLSAFLWNTVTASCTCEFHMRSLACISLSSLGLPDWIARVTYLALCLVFLCGSSNYVDLGWRQSQNTVHRNILHGTVCSADFDVALKQTLLPKWMHYWTPCNYKAWFDFMSSLLTISICKPQKAESVCLHVSKNCSYAHRKEQVVHSLICQDWRSLWMFYQLSLLFKNWEKKWGMAKRLWNVQ